MKKRIIWNSNPDFSEDDLAYFKEEYGDLSDDELFDLAMEENARQLEDEQANLDKELPGRIIVIADVGLWYGRRNGYKVLGSNLNEILYSQIQSASELNVFGDGYNIRADEQHHDGCNHYLYRMIRPGVSDHWLDNVELTQKALNRYTRSLYPYVAEIYGWPCRQKAKV